MGNPYASREYLASPNGAHVLHRDLDYYPPEVACLWVSDIVGQVRITHWSAVWCGGNIMSEWDIPFRWILIKSLDISGNGLITITSTTGIDGPPGVRLDELVAPHYMDSCEGATPELALNNGGNVVAIGA